MTDACANQASTSTIPLTAPGTSQPLQKCANCWRTVDGAIEYPIVHGVPVVFPRSAEPTFDAYASSRQATDCADAWHVETLAIDEQSQELVRRELAANVESAVDPAVNQLVCATNGIAYESRIGKLVEYPIPRLPVAPVPGASLLDIGSSWGRWCVSAGRLGFAVYGIDPSLGAVLTAQRVFQQMGLSGAFVCGDGRALPFPDNSFDLVHSYSVLQHFSDADAELTWSEIGRVLKPGGRAVVQMANAFGVRSAYHLGRRGFRTARGFEVRYRSPRQLREFGERYGGPTTLSVDCYFGLGLQPSDQHLYGWPAWFAVNLSESLKRMARVFPPMKWLADSLYVQSVKTTPGAKDGRDG